MTDNLQLQQDLARVRADYDAWCARKIKLDMSRGKPCADQLALSSAMYSALTPDDYLSRDGIDCRNYGVLDGLPEARELMAPMVGTTPDRVIVGGNASLSLMYDLIAQWMVHGVSGHGPWAGRETAFICPSPGYDRHFAITESFGIRMIPVEMTPTGPDMDTVERLVAQDDTIRGIWCVPKYSNPDGITYSAETVRRLASMPCAAPDFRIMWDNAYVIHDLYDTTDPLENILDACEKAGNPDRAVVFASTSKITFPGSGIAALGTSAANRQAILKRMGVQTIGHDKLNQLRHVRFFGDFDGMLAHMQKHADLLRPRFEKVEEVLRREFGDQPEMARWHSPRGGYFISLFTPEGTAKRICALAKEAGLVLTGAGATWPYGRDPHDNNLRIAPSFPSLDQLEMAMELLVVCIRLAALEKAVEQA